VKILLPKEPKELRSFVLTELNVVELNDIEVDRLLPHIYESAIKQGRYSGALKDFSADAYEGYLTSLLGKEYLTGFADDLGRDVLDAWLRASVVAFGSAGRARQSAKMDYIHARTVAAYRAGFPDRRRDRQADTVTYEQLLQAVERRQVAGTLPSDRTPRQALAEIVRRTVGEGVEISDPPKWAPSYDGETRIDISTLLALRFLEEFEARSAQGEVREKGGLPSRQHLVRKNPPVPAATSPLGTDVLSYLISYGEVSPARSVAQHLSAVLGIRLFQLPLRTTLAIHSLLLDDTLPKDMAGVDATNPLEQFADFTGDKSSDAFELARNCVQRDLRLIQTGLRDRLLLRSTLRAAQNAQILPEDFHQLPGPERFAMLCRLTSDPTLEPFFKIDLQAIRSQNQDNEDEEAKEFIKRLSDGSRPVVDRLTDALYEATKITATGNWLKWFRTAGGLGRDNGILVGDQRNRASWAYAPGNDLLTAMLGIVFTTQTSTPLRAMPLAEVLRRLEAQFGLLIDRPPSDMSNVATRAAAGANLDAFKRRLKLLGVFDGLSDDFTAQIVLNPLTIAAK